VKKKALVCPNPATCISTTTEIGRLQKLEKKQIEMSISRFTKVFVADGIMGLVSKTITKEWPEGFTYLVVRGLMKKFRPIDTISNVEVKQQLN
jgi:hypothetical protein